MSYDQLPMGKLQFDPMSKRWRIYFLDKSTRELSSGSCLEVRIDRHWIPISIEHGPNGYYAIPSTVNLRPGMEARFPL